MMSRIAVRVLAVVGLAISPVLGAQTSPPTITPEAQLSAPAGRTATTAEIKRNIALVGSDGYPSATGLVQVYQKQNGSWTAQGTLTRPNAFIGDRFGGSMEWDGRTLVIGSPGDPSGADGAIAIYERVDGNFVLRQVIDVPGGEPNFGLRLSLHGDRLAVSATIGFSTTNAVYVFKRDVGGLWAQQAHLQPPQEYEDQLGIAVDLRDDRLIIGADQSSPVPYALIYREVNSQWQLETRIERPDGFGAFGRAVEIHGDRAWIGNPGSMTAHEYRRTNGAWTLTSSITGTAGPYFSGVLQLRGKRNLFVVDNNRIYLYSAAAGVWSQRATFTVPAAPFFDPQNEEALDVSGRKVAAVSSGSVYVFDVPDGLME
jgi:hypothetical protein